jgi:uncharacterized membrane-anchored protein
MARIIAPFRCVAIVWAELLKKNLSVWRVIAEIVASAVGGDVMKKAISAFASVCVLSMQRSEKTMKERILIIIFQSICCWLTLVTAAAHPLTPRPATASAYIERGNAWFPQGEYERAFSSSSTVDYAKQ